MSKRDEMAERQGRILGELAELGMSLARDLHGRALAADTPKAVVDLGIAFHRISRSVRQTLALEAKLDRDREQAARGDRVEAVRERQGRISQRADQVRAVTARAIWTEAEGDEAERLLNDLDDWLEVESFARDFADRPIEDLIARVCADLGVTPPARDPGSEASVEGEGAEGAIPRAVHRQSSD
jgi:hypothetical protein